MKPDIQITPQLHAKVISEFLNMPMEVVLRGLRQLTSEQWSCALHETGRTKQSTMNRLSHLKATQSELQGQLLLQLKLTESDV